jgi:phospholipase D1/2
MYHDARTTGEEAKVHGEGAYYDIYNSINNAKKHIFISGWSLNVDMRLNRDVDESLGQLLIRKSHEDGVTVCVLLWRSSAEGNLITDTFSGIEKKADVGGTRNFSAYRFFENSLVQIKLWGANPLSKHIFTIYGKTMHQKFIICDTDNGNDSMAYIGGLDLSFGRYDTPEHPLFPEDNSDFMKYAFNEQLPDKDQNTFYGNVRLPWHDIHMAVTGDIVKDLAKHFYDRWTHALFTDKCTFLRGNQAADKHANLNLLELVKVATKETERGPYNSQLLLSFGETEKNAEKSIQKAYLTTIALAKQFIYIESQFLIGGSMMWEDPNEYGNNQIPVQILLRIEEAIRYKQQFKVYVVIPLFPDNQKYMPHVMYNQFQTIKMMYRVIGLMIKKHRGTDSNAPKPDDYLFIGCLGKSEVNKKDNKAEHNQIYVHSKMMIIDDRFIIAGSANLNERSMNGAMDAEICVSLWNKNHTGANMAVIQAEERHDAELGTEPQEEKVQPEEEPVAENEPVKLFRKRIWKEVFGEEITKYDPQSSKCMELVQALAAANRKHFLAKEPLESGHIMRAPFTVDSNGTAKSEKVGINYINKVSGQEYLKGLDFAGTKAYTFTLQFL